MNMQADLKELWGLIVNIFGGSPVKVCRIRQIVYCYLIIRNAEALLVEIKSCDRHYKLLHTHWCNMNVNTVYNTLKYAYKLH